MRLLPYSFHYCSQPTCTNQSSFPFLSVWLHSFFAPAAALGHLLAAPTRPSHPVVGHCHLAAAFLAPSLFLSLASTLLPFVINPWASHPCVPSFPVLLLFFYFSSPGSLPLIILPDIIFPSSFSLCLPLLLLTSPLPRFISSTSDARTSYIFNFQRSTATAIFFILIFLITPFEYLWCRRLRRLFILYTVLSEGFTVIPT